VSDTRSRTPVAGGEHSPRTSPGLFLRQVLAELRKVVWPTQQQVITYFFVVLVFVGVMMAYVAGLDFGLGKAMFAVFG
jgi:preprotein translocase subunit SecE